MELSLAKLKQINTGANSRVFMYGDSSSAVAIKMVPSSAAKESKHLENQYKVLKEVQHQNIIMALKLKRNVSIRLEEERKQNILVLEWAEGGSLLDVVRRNRFQIPELRSLFSQTCEAVQYLHCNYFVHRDIKLENVLLVRDQDQLTAKLADFGFASNCRNGDHLILYNEYKGTKRGYMAPEIHAILEPNHQPYDARKSDVFALGVLLFAMMMGKLPFDLATKQNRFYRLILQENYEMFWKEHADGLRIMELKEPCLVNQFKQLFIGMVKANPSHRLDIEDVLESEWLQGPHRIPKAL